MYHPMLAVLVMLFFLESFSRALVVIKDLRSHTPTPAAGRRRAPQVAQLPAQRPLLRRNLPQHHAVAEAVGLLVHAPHAQQQLGRGVRERAGNVVQARHVALRPRMRIQLAYPEKPSSPQKAFWFPWCCPCA